jgi:hypothetical protein
MKFIKWEETNDHEGETWFFWLQVDGNEDELLKLSALVDDYQGESYWLHSRQWEKHYVDFAVEEGGWGYMNTHTKVTGVFTCPDYETSSDGLDFDDWMDDKFYKGRIENYFKES